MGILKSLRTLLIASEVPDWHEIPTEAVFFFPFFGVNTQVPSCFFTRHSE